MSTCISQHGEYSEHDLPGTKFSEFDCNLCYAFVEDAALAEIERLRAKVVRVEALASTWEGWAARRSTTRVDAFRDAAEDLRAALAAEGSADLGT